MYKQWKTEHIIIMKSQNKEILAFTLKKSDLLSGDATDEAY